MRAPIRAKTCMFVRTAWSLVILPNLVISCCYSYILRRVLACTCDFDLDKAIWKRFGIKVSSGKKWFVHEWAKPYILLIVSKANWRPRREADVNQSSSAYEPYSCSAATGSGPGAFDCTTNSPGNDDGYRHWVVSAIMLEDVSISYLVLVMVCSSGWSRAARTMGYVHLARHHLLAGKADSSHQYVRPSMRNYKPHLGRFKPPPNVPSHDLLRYIRPVSSLDIDKAKA